MKIGYSPKTSSTYGLIGHFQEEIMKGVASTGSEAIPCPDIEDTKGLEGFFTINSLTLKRFDPEGYKALHQQLKKAQMEVRNEKFPLHDIPRIRSRNMRLQRLHQALNILEHSARERKVHL